MTRVASAIALALLALPSAAAAQEPPACAPDKLLNVTITSLVDGQEGPLVATHEVDISADFNGDATNVVLTPQPGVSVIGDSSGRDISVFAPSTPTLTVSASWRQPADPSDSDNTARCSGSGGVTLPVLAANSARGVRQPNPGPNNGFFTFAVAPAARRPDLSPLEISVRSTGQARYPRAKERLRTWTVPMRTAEQLRYRTRLPNLAYATTAQVCRFWWLTCGPVFASVAQLNVNNRGRPDLDGSNAILRTLARTQPARWAAEFGIVITATPGAARPQQFGYDLQVRQDGRLLARVRRAGRCVSLRRSTGIFDKCTLARGSTLLR